MKYFVSIGAQTHEVEVEGNRVTVDRVGLETDLAPVSGTPLYHLLLAGASWTVAAEPLEGAGRWTLGLVGERDRKSTRLNSSHITISYAVFCLKKKKKKKDNIQYIHNLTAIRPL